MSIFIFNPSSCAGVDCCDYAAKIVPPEAASGYSLIIVGGTAPYTYKWSLAGADAGTIAISGSSTNATVDITGAGEALLMCRITDANGSITDAYYWVGSGAEGTVYPDKEIVFGDGSTPGGVTSSKATYDPATDELLIVDVNGDGIAFAGAGSVGLPPVVGIAVDVFNYFYSIGNPTDGNTLTVTATGNVLQSITGTSTVAGANGVTFISGTGFTFNSSTILNIGGKDINFSAPNAAGFWYNDGAGAISYVNGASGSFTAQTGEVVTVVNGLITSIV